MRSKKIITALANLAMAGLPIGQATAPLTPTPIDHRQSAPIAWHLTSIKVSRAVVGIQQSILVMENDHLARLDSSTGRILWDVQVLAPSFTPANTPAARFLQLTAPAIAGSSVIVAASEGGASQIVSLDAATGRIRWTHDIGAEKPSDILHGTSMSVPAIFGDKVIVRTGRGLTALQLSDGKELWNSDFDSGIPMQTSASDQPISDGHSIYFNSDTGIAYAFDLNDGHLRWATMTKGMTYSAKGVVLKISVHPCFCTPALIDGAVITADGLGNVYAVKTTDGSILWKISPGYTFQISASASSVYVSTDTGFAEIDPKTGTIRHQLKNLGRVIAFQIVGDHVLLADLHPGWSALDLKTWQVTTEDPTFCAQFGIRTVGNTVIAAGSDQGRDGPNDGEVRAYRLSDLFHNRAVRQ